MSANITTRNLENATLKIGIYHQPPTIIIEHLPSGEQKITGIATEILETIAKCIGYKYSYVTYPTGMVGREINGTWDGIIGGLIKKDIDVDGVFLVKTSYRQKVVDFSTSALYENFVGVVIRKPIEEQNLSFLTYFKPYPTNVWVIIVLLWLTTCICTTILDNGFVTKIWKSILLRTFLLEKLSEEKFGLKVSKMITLWAFFVSLILLLSGYNSVLVASVAVKHPVKQFKNIDELLKDGSYRFGANHNYYYYRNICEMKDPPYGELGRIMEADPDSNILDMDIGFKRALNNKFAFLVESIFGQYGIQSTCSLEMLPAKYFSSRFHISFPKRSPLREIVSRYIHRLRTSGILHRIAEYRISPSRPQCEEATNKVIPMSLNYLIFPFSILGCGIIISVLAVVFEILNSQFVI